MFQQINNAAFNYNRHITDGL